MINAETRPGQSLQHEFTGGEFYALRSLEGRMIEAFTTAIPVLVPAILTITSTWGTILTIDQMKYEVTHRGIIAALRWSPLAGIFILMAFAWAAFTISAGINAV